MTLVKFKEINRYIWSMGRLFLFVYLKTNTYDAYYQDCKLKQIRVCNHGTPSFPRAKNPSVIRGSTAYIVLKFNVTTYLPCNDTYFYIICQYVLPNCKTKRSGEKPDLKFYYQSFVKGRIAIILALFIAVVSCL